MSLPIQVCYYQNLIILEETSSSRCHYLVQNQVKNKDTSSGHGSDSSGTPSTTSRYPIRRNRLVFKELFSYF